MEQRGQPETVDSAADAPGRTHRLKTVDLVLPEFSSFQGRLSCLAAPLSSEAQLWRAMCTSMEIRFHFQLLTVAFFNILLQLRFLCVQICDDSWDEKDATVACRSSQKLSFDSNSQILRMLDFSVGVPRVGSKYEPLKLFLDND